VLPSARERILATLPDDARVLDVGGWAVPFSRADHVIDVAPYETRGEWGYDGSPGEDRFSADTWLIRDICDREPWPFAEDHFDFAVCSHTLEDVRDPIWVCSELSRVAKAGYAEVPSRLWEQTWGLQGEFVGFSHHRWLIDLDARTGALVFVNKAHTIHVPGPDCFPPGFAETLSDEEKFLGVWWEGELPARERLILNAPEIHEYLRAPVLARGVSWPDRGSAAGPLRRRLRRLLP
jgi:SAM-dependent methyltransferase